MNFRDYKTASKYAEQINAGYSARLSNAFIQSSPEYDASPEGMAFNHGWYLADADEMKRKDGIY